MLCDKALQGHCILLSYLAVQKYLLLLLLLSALRCAAEPVLYSWPATMLDDPRGRPQLAQAIEQGLRIAMLDGSRFELQCLSL
jgi:hypothetical protein